MRKLLVSLIVLAFAVVPVNAATIVDGGFENPHFDGESYAVYYDGDTMGGWSVSSPDTYGILLAYDTVNAPPRMWDMVFPEGTQALHIGESARENTISQVISDFVVGQTYEISIAACVWGEGYLNANLLQVYNADTASYDLDAVVVGSIRGMDRS